MVKSAGCLAPAALRSICHMFGLPVCARAPRFASLHSPLLSHAAGLSEEILGEFIKKTGTKPEIATKFAPLPWRFGRGSVVSACKVLTYSYKMGHPAQEPCG